MIVFNLTCGNDHRFEGWFASTADFERQQRATLLNCPLCGSTDISKGLHAPYVNVGSAPQKSEAPASGVVAANAGAEVAKLVEHLIANTEDVGEAFPEEARKIHYRETPERRIRGQASQDEVRELRDEGIDIVTLPLPTYLLNKTH